MLRGLCKLYSSSLSLSPPSRGRKKKAPGKTKVLNNAAEEEEEENKTPSGIYPLFTLFLFSFSCFVFVAPRQSKRENTICRSLYVSYDIESGNLLVSAKRE